LSFLTLGYLASQKLGLEINLFDGYKLCDFKPTYGVVFEDYLNHYDFWGYCDIDVIWGRISRFITEEILNTYDIVTTKTAYLAGHFTLYRNSGIARDLFRCTDDYKIILADKENKYFAFDETCHRWDRSYTLQEVKALAQMASITDIAMDLHYKQKVRVYMKNLVREYPDPFHFTYDHGVFTDHLNDTEEFMYFHLVHLKNNWKFLIPPMSKLPSEFAVVAGGIIPGSINNLFVVFKWKLKKASSVIKHKLQRLQQVSVDRVSTLVKLNKRIV
jgi:hypothetical protein